MTEKKKRLCLFAGFDAQGEIADYVVYYLKALSEIADVYYWGDFEASDKEKAKIEPYCQAVYCARHEKYDFGSWQELIQKLGREQIATYDELILANDSCYGPLFPLPDLFQTMDARECDFWGLSAACRNHIHLQSYFVVLHQPVLQSDVLYQFFDQVKPEGGHDDVCAIYEDRFTYILSKAGFRFSSYITYGDTANHPYQDIMAAIQNRHFPLLKVRFFLGGIRDQAGVADWRQVIRDNTNYPVELIEQDLVRRGLDLAVVDQSVQEKQSETPNFYPRRSPWRTVVKKSGKVLLKPVLSLADAYFNRRSAQYFYKLDRLNRAHRRLQAQYNALRAQNDPDFAATELRLKDSGKACNLTLTDVDASLVKRFDLELPLTDESHVLLIGNLSSHNFAALELYDPKVSFLDNDWAEDLKVRSFRTDALCTFMFIEGTGRPVYFDFILVQPLAATASDAEITKFLTNLKRQMLFESVLVMLVSSREADKYRQLLQSVGLHPATSERGLIVRSDPFQTYYDKIESIKGYEALIYKLK